MIMGYKISVAIAGFLIWAGTTTVVIAADADGGKALYEKSCAGCHGADGKGNEKMAKIPGFDKGLNIVGAETKKKSDAQLLKLVAEGAGKMPASKLTKDEQKQALSYARSLAK
jgi:mono/diheme cytochrome c family protein